MKAMRGAFIKPFVLIGAILLLVAFVFRASRDYRIEVLRDVPVDSTEPIRLYPFVRKALGSQASIGISPPVDILLAGIPGPGNPAPNLTDTVMLARLDSQKPALALISLPRDLIVDVPGLKGYMRLNAVYERGEASGRGTGAAMLGRVLEDITAVRPHHHLIVDLALVRDVVDALGGVNISVEKTVFDPLFPGPAFSYEPFELQKGWRYLDGETATKYVRTRFGPDGDFGRMSRQQELVQAVKQKIAGLSLIWDLPIFLKIYESAARHIRTDFTTEELVALYELVKTIRPDDIRTVLVDADPEKNLLIPGEFWFGAERASIVKPTTGIGNYESIKTYVAKILENP